MIPELNDLTIKPQSETSVVVYFGEVISEETLKKITFLSELIHNNPFRGLVETVPAYTSLTIFYDTLNVAQDKTLQGNYAFEKVTWYLKNLPAGTINLDDHDQPIIDIPVCYGADYAPDLEEVARYSKLTVNEVIHLHSSATYIVYMLGFMPGFPYLGGMNKLLATPRKSLPRKLVPAGAVGIAGEQTGIYPLQSPGGWQLIGRTPLTLFQPKKEVPSLLKAGDKIRFKSISRAEFIELNR